MPTQAPGATTYNYAQLEQIWISAGGNPQAAATAAAVAMAESGGNPNAVSPTNDYGLWQINIVHGSQATLDVMGNARAAVAISNNGTNWGPWCSGWADPNANCGKYMGPILQPASRAASFLQPGIQPDSTTPLNATSGVTPQQAQLEFLGIGGGSCSGLEWAISPGTCAAGGAISGAAGAAAGAVGGEVTHLAGQVIDAMIGGILNPLIQLVAGVMGITAGGTLMVLGLYMAVKDTTAVQAVKGMATTAAITAVAPEAAPAAGGASGTGVNAQGNKAANRQVQQRVRQTQSVSQRQAKAQVQKQRREALRAQARKYATEAAAGA